MKNLKAIVKKIYNVGFPGFLYRAGDDGIFYHTDPDGARFYGDDIKIFEYPEVSKIFVIHDDEIPTSYDGVDESFILNDLIRKYNLEFGLDDDDWVLGVEKLVVPDLFKKGFDCILIHAETGFDVQGYPLEVVLKNKPIETKSPKALATLIDQY